MPDFTGLFENPQGLVVSTNRVFDDEPCFSLREENRLSKSGKSFCRYQILRVVRDDRLVTAVVYLGMAANYTADPFQVVSGVIDDDGKGEALYSVAEVRDVADEIRARPPRREVKPQDLQGQYVAHVEETIRKQRHQSTFGSKVSLVRN
jgi:hypothetical protein